MSRTSLGGDQIFDQTITNADVSASAAISGSKISPDFGTQDILATGYLGLRAESSPGVAAATTGRIYFDIGLNKFRISEDGGAYADLLGTSGVSGTGAAGRVAFWDSATSLSSDTNLFWDDANNRLGIGTATPAYPLDVVGDINISAGSVFRINGTPFTASPGGSSGQIQVNNAGALFGNAQLSWNFQDLRIGDATATGYMSLSLNAHPSYFSYIRFQHGGGMEWDIRQGQSNEDLVFIDGASALVVFQRGTGNVGMMTTLPESQLDVSFNSSKWARFGNSAWSTRIGQLADGKQWIGTGVNKTAADSLYKAYTGNNATVNHLIMEMNYANTNGGFNFFGQTHAVDGTTLTPATILHLDVNGRVGISNTAPAALLSVGTTSQFQVDSTGSMLTSSTGYVALGGASLGSGSQRIKLPDAEFIVWNTTSAKIGAGSTNMVINAATGGANAVLVNYGGAGSAGTGGFLVYDGLVVSPLVKFRVDPAGTTSYIVGQFGVNNSAPNAAAQLQVDSTTKGFLPPRMTTAQRDAISSPPAGLVIYNTTTSALEVFV